MVGWMTQTLLEDLGGELKGQVGFVEEGDGVFRGTRMTLPDGWDRL